MSLYMVILDASEELVEEAIRAAKLDQSNYLMDWTRHWEH